MPTDPWRPVHHDAVHHDAVHHDDPGHYHPGPRKAGGDDAGRDAAGRDDAGRDPAGPRAGGDLAQAAPASADRDARDAMLAYLGVPFTGLVAPLILVLLTMRRSRFARAHARQALSVSVTGLLYDICILIIGVMLALDSVEVAVLVAVPLAALLWLLTLVFLIRAAVAASRGEPYAFPRWLRASAAVR